MNEDIRGRVVQLLGTIRPLFQSDGIELELLGVRGTVVSIHVDASGCTGCASPQEVIESGLGRLIQEKIPEVTQVIAV